MEKKRVFVLGAYGQVGRSVCHVLIEQTDVAIVLGGRRLGRVQEVAAAANCPERVTACFVDAGQPESLRNAIKGSDLVIFTATARDAVEHVARACLACGCDYLDTLETEDAVLALRRLEGEMQGAGRLFIAQCGLAPGISGVMLRHAHAAFTRMRRARVAMAFSLQTIERKEQVYDIFEFVVKNKPIVYRDGEWRSQTLGADRVVVDCGPRFGRRAAIPLDMFEARDLPRTLRLESFGYYATAANRVVDVLVRRLLLALHRIKPRLGWPTLAGLALRLARTSGEARGGATIVEAEGDGGQDRSLHLLIDVDDNYLGVAKAVVVIARQWLDGAFQGRAGVHLMGELAEPTRTLADLAAMGAACRETWRSTPLAGG